MENTLGKSIPRVTCIDASPGRFFAVSELKAMLAHVLLTYDMMVPDGKRPQNWEFGVRSLPNMNANIMFKLRT